MSEEKEIDCIDVPCLMCGGDGVFRESIGGQVHAPIHGKACTLCLGSGVMKLVGN